jgi:hypothetical protein
MALHEFGTMKNTGSGTDKWEGTLTEQNVSEFLVRLRQMMRGKSISFENVVTENGESRIADTSQGRCSTDNEGNEILLTENQRGACDKNGTWSLSFSVPQINLRFFPERYDRSFRFHRPDRLTIIHNDRQRMGIQHIWNIQVQSEDREGRKPHWIGYSRSSWNLLQYLHLLPICPGDEQRLELVYEKSGTDQTFLPHHDTEPELFHDAYSAARLIAHDLSGHLSSSLWSPDDFACAFLDLRTFNVTRYDGSTAIVFRWIEDQSSLLEFCDRHPKGQYVVKVPGHVFCVLDGRVYDECPERAKGREIVGWWEIQTPK